MTREPSIRLIVSVVATTFGVPATEIISPRRTADIMTARFAAYLLARQMTCKSFPTIGRAIGGRDHSSVIYGNANAELMHKNSEPFRDLVEAARIAIAAIATSRFATAFDDSDTLTLARSILVNPEHAAMRIAGSDLAALAARVLAYDDVATLTVQLLTTLDELILSEPPHERRAALTSVGHATINHLTSALAELGHPKPETTNGQADQKAEGAGTESTGAAVA
jgi:chromosomal replication initiator protein